MQTKKTFPKILIFFYLIPYLASLLLTALDFLMNEMYLQWYWLTEWMVAVPEMLAYYILLAMIFASFGILVYQIFFGATWQKWTFSLITVAISFLFPFSRYLIRHVTYGAFLEDIYMLDMFYDDLSTGLSLLFYSLTVLFVILAVRAYYAWILREKPTMENKIYSPKNPIGISMMIFFGSIAALSALNFFLAGEFSGDAFLALLLEFVIDTAGFTISVFGAYTVSKWSSPVENEECV